MEFSVVVAGTMVLRVIFQHARSNACVARAVSIGFAAASPNELVISHVHRPTDVGSILRSGTVILLYRGLL